MLCKVLDLYGTELAPTKKEKAWFKVRKGKAKLISKEPMIIKLDKIVNKKKEGNKIMENTNIRVLDLMNSDMVEKYNNQIKTYQQINVDSRVKEIIEMLYQYYKGTQIAAKYGKDFWTTRKEPDVTFFSCLKEVEESDYIYLSHQLRKIEPIIHVCGIFKEKDIEPEEAFILLKHYVALLYSGIRHKDFFGQPNKKETCEEKAQELINLLKKGRGYDKITLLSRENDAEFTYNNTDKKFSIEIFREHSKLSYTEEEFLKVLSANLAFEVKKQGMVKLIYRATKIIGTILNGETVFTQNYERIARQLIDTIKDGDNECIRLDSKDFASEISYDVNTNKFIIGITKYHTSGTIGRITDNEFSYNEKELLELLLNIFTDYEGEIKAREIKFGATSVEKIEFGQKVAEEKHYAPAECMIDGERSSIEEFTEKNKETFEKKKNACWYRSVNKNK